MPVWAGLQVHEEGLVGVFAGYLLFTHSWPGLAGVNYWSLSTRADLFGFQFLM